MYPTQLTRRRGAMGAIWPGIPDSWWPFPPSQTPLPADPIACMQQYPITTWDVQNSKCVFTNPPENQGPPASGSGSLYGLMQQACQGIGCSWDDVGKTCVCSASKASAIAPEASGSGTCPAGSMPMAVPSIPGTEGYNLPTQVCVPVSGGSIPQIPNLNIPNVPPIPQITPQGQGQQTQTASQGQGWWSQQSDGTKIAIIAGGSAVGLGLIYLMVKAGSRQPRYGY